MYDACAAAAASSAVLDVKVPGWAREIDTGLLDLDDCMSCVLAQLCGNYAAGLAHRAVLTLAETPPMIVSPSRAPSRCTPPPHRVLRWVNGGRSSSRRMAATPHDPSRIRVRAEVLTEPGAGPPAAGTAPCVCSRASSDR